MLTCVFGLTACGGTIENIKYDEAAIKTQCVYMYGLVANDKTEEALNSSKYLDLNDDGLDILAEDIFKEFNVRTEGTVIIKGYDSFNNTLEELGPKDKVEPTGEFEFDAKKDELIVSMLLKGPEHDGSIEFMFDKNLHLTSMTTNAKYSLGESMKKAGINTGIGMGTVFTMLIVIMFIIKLLGVIPKIQEKSAKKKAMAKKADTETSVDNTIQGIVEREEAEDDLELVAVISAAIAAMEGTSTDGFVVRSIKRIR